MQAFVLHKRLCDPLFPPVCPVSPAANVYMTKWVSFPHHHHWRHAGGGPGLELDRRRVTGDRSWEFASSWHIGDNGEYNVQRR